MIRARIRFAGFGLFCVPLPEPVRSFHWQYQRRGPIFAGMTPDSEQLHGLVPGRQFAETRWSLVLKAGSPGAPGADEALESLCRLYWYPVYGWIRGRKIPQEEAQDLTQEFFAALLRRRAFEKAEPARGRFRAFLAGSLRNFLTDHHRTESAERRGGGVKMLEWDALDAEGRYALEPAAGDSPDAAFDRRWSRVLIERAFARLESEQARMGNDRTFAVLRDFVASPPEAGAYQEAADRLGVGTNTVAAAVSRLRRRCREIIMEEILETVSGPAEAGEELRALFGN